RRPRPRRRSSSRSSAPTRRPSTSGCIACAHSRASSRRRPTCARCSRAAAACTTRRPAGARARRVPGRSRTRTRCAAYPRCSAPRSRPQLPGRVRPPIAPVRDVVTVEITAVTDNPVFFPDEDAVLHAGNFHGQPLALAADHLKVALAEVALFSERRLARLLDPATNDGLPPFLIRDSAGLRSGLMGLQYCASATVAENAVLAHPAS